MHDLSEIVLRLEQEVVGLLVQDTPQFIKLAAVYICIECMYRRICIHVGMYMCVGVGRTVALAFKCCKNISSIRFHKIHTGVIYKGGSFAGDCVHMCE